MGISYETLAAKGPRSYSIEDFRGDFTEVASLIQRSWAENSKQPLLYTAEFLASCFEYPGASFSLAPTLYEGLRPVAFASGFPRRLRFKNRVIHVIVSSFLSVATEYKKRGYGVILWNELVKRAQAAGLDGMVNYCVDGEPMNGMILGCCRRLRLAAARIYSVHYLSRLLWPAEFDKTEHELEGGISKAFLELAAPIVENLPLARIWSAEEADWQSTRRLGAITAWYAEGPRKGVLTGYVMQIADPDRTKCLLVEDLLWGSLEQHERQLLLRQLLNRAAGAGARIAIVPVLGYADLEPFLAVRFRASRRILNAYLVMWGGDTPIEELPSMYLDVF
jgi:GNAT superfamily N-acetyltransferase